jgi:hypothetical protein
VDRELRRPRIERRDTHGDSDAATFSPGSRAAARGRLSLWRLFPEPATEVLLMLAAAGLGVLRHKQQLCMSGARNPLQATAPPNRATLSWFKHADVVVRPPFGQ